MVAVRKSGLFSIVMVCLLCAAQVLVAQSGQGPAAQFVVNVTDTSGGVIEGAVAVLRHGNVERRETTGVDGNARFPNLENGEWTLEIRKEGFRVDPQTVAVGSGASPFPVKLELSSLSQSVAVQAGLGSLETTQTSATRLEIALNELPATLNVVTQEMMQARGANNAMDAIEAAGGTLVSPGLGGQLPGYQTRGFSSNSVLNDGIRQNSGVQSSRPVDTFLMDRVEVLKGPASLLAGEGGTAGTVNYVSKTPRQDFGVDSLISYGSFGAKRAGLGMTGPLGKNLMGRIDASYSYGGGYVKPSNQKLRASAASLWWTPKPALTVKLNGKYTDDWVNAYYNTPFVNGQVDPHMRFINYNMADAFSRAHNNFGHADVDINLGRGWTMHNETFAATQRMDYRNMESYSYTPATQQVAVSGYFLIWRHDVLLGNQTDFHKTAEIFGHSVNFIVGSQEQHNNMQRAKNPAEASNVRFNVDPFLPQTFYDPQLPYFRVPDVIVNDMAVYGEAQVRLARKWTSVLGIRTEQIAAHYGLVFGDTSKELNYDPTTGRAGLVYTMSEKISLYGSYSRSIEPATQFVSLSGCCGTAAAFNLTPARQYEAGVKGSALRGRIEGTVAYFDIVKRDLPVNTIINDVSVPQIVGRQTSKGVEVSVVARPSIFFLLNADFAGTRGRYADFTEVVNGVNVSRSGNLPPNVPSTIFNVNPTFQIGRFVIAANGRQVGDRWGDTANTRHIGSYATIDAWFSAKLPQGARFTFRARNLTDKLYIVQPGTTSGHIGAPRSYEVALAFDGRSR